MPENKYRPNRAFSLVTGALICLALLALIFGLMHQSSQPTILGRYSSAYFTLLLALAAVVVVLTWLLVAPHPTLVRWAGNLYAVLISTFVAVMGAEIALRVVNPWGIELFGLLPYHMQGMVDHPQLGYVHPRSITYRLGENRVTLNSHGHRDDDMPFEKPAGERRILVLGDSVTFGWGVDQGQDFPARLEALIREQLGGAWQVINAGVNGYNSEQEATFLSTDGLRFQPNIVLLIYVSNDVDPIIEPNAVTWRRYPTWPSSLPDFLDRVRTHSRLYQTSKLFQRMEELRPPPRDGPQRSVTDHPGWPASLESLKFIAATCKQGGVHFLLAMAANSSGKALELMRQGGIDAITLDSAWSRVATEKHHVSRIDPHPSAAVHMEFAKVLLEEVRSRGWLDASTRPQIAPLR